MMETFLSMLALAGLVFLVCAAASAGIIAGLDLAARLFGPLRMPFKTAEWRDRP